MGNTAVTSNNQRSDKLKIFIILFALTLVAVVIRGRGLGKWCFTIDEYYTYKSVSFILEKGIPQFPGGGYYSRGLIVQYLMALSSLIFPNPEFAARFVPLMFGVLSVPLFFLISRLFLPTFPSLLCSLLLLFSSWHIEFSRFARMYVPFQFVFFSFIYLFYSGYYLNRMPHQIYSWVIAFISVFIYEGAIFLPFILLTPILLDESPMNRRTTKIILAFLLLIGINYLVNGMNYRNLGITNQYPADLVIEKRGLGIPGIPIFLPESNLFRIVFGSFHLILGYLLCIIGGAYVFFKQWEEKENFWEMIFITVAVVFPLLHQYGFLFYILMLLFILHKSIFHTFKEQRKYWIPYFVLTILFWFTVGVMNRNLIFSWETTYPIVTFFKRMFSIMFGYPKIFEAIILPFAKVIPLWGFLILITFLGSIFHYLSTTNIDSRQFLLSIILVCVFFVSIFKVPYKEPRYSFFYFPLVFIVGYKQIILLTEMEWKYFGKTK